ncbi:Major allergen Asp f 2 [Penicillium canariense]|uniref:Major allergen Asp f 2 n=1 Tax=Penicillium canariense TaxID=189055 RepID=A0A9W9IER3_9EURO|nr:Major allergen Asp f 2 [Penicillium canariense]KAJ5175072.1 Major allergen Asp f 2 [Penicillium canariense]
MAPLLNVLLFLATTAAALPALSSGNQSRPFTQTSVSPWNEGAVTQFSIHPSCNATQRRQIELGLAEAVTLAAHARDHILRWRNESEIYRKYFGNRPTLEAIGAFEVVVNGDKDDILFRCDNPDGNCALKGYAGHWRGENGTDETVICDLSYETRRSLSTMCGLGYTVSGSETNTFWASDLLHRLYHLPTIGQYWVDHFADGYEEVINLAAENATLSTHDSETLQYFALEVYSHDVSVPGVGCPGEQHSHRHDDEVTADTRGSEATATATTIEAPSTTSDVPANCHTHEGGELHCT